VTVILPDNPVVAAVDVRGGGPGTRETDALGLEGSVDEVHGIVLSGGSAFGLDAATGAQRWLAGRKIGFAVGDARVPIVPSAILFDLLNGGDKSRLDGSLYSGLAGQACETAGLHFDLGTAGAGYGATTARYAGGLGSASCVLENGIALGAVAAVNPVGCVTRNASAPNVWASDFEFADEFYSGSWATNDARPSQEPPLKGERDTAVAGRNTTLCVIATDARLSKRDCKRLAIMAQTGLARAISPVHTPLDGDVVFALSTGPAAALETPADLALLGAHAATTLARAITRGVCEAGRNAGDWPGESTWSARFDLC